MSRRSSRENKGKLPQHFQNFFVNNSEILSESEPDTSFESAIFESSEEMANDDDPTITESIEPNMNELKAIIENLATQVQSIQSNLSGVVNEFRQDKEARQQINAQLQQQVLYQSQSNSQITSSLPLSIPANTNLCNISSTATTSNLNVNIPASINCSNYESSSNQSSSQNNILHSRAIPLQTIYSVQPCVQSTSSQSCNITEPSCSYNYLQSSRHNFNSVPAFSSIYSNVSLPMPPNNQQIPLSSRISHITHENRRKLHDLPEFSGKPEEWPMFYSTFQESTAAFGYTQLENTFRLQKCLKNEARECVECLLIHPNNVDDVIRQLEFRFGRPEHLIKSQILKVRNIPAIPENRMEQLIPLATKVQNLATFIESTGSIQHLGNPILLEELVNKLPMSKRIDWAHHSINFRPYSTIVDFSKWLTQVAQIVSLVVPPIQNITHIPEKRREKDSSGRKNVLLHMQQNQTKSIRCSRCSSEDHFIIDCPDFKKMNIENKWEFVKKNSLCFSCLKGGHNIQYCRKRKICNVDDCRKPHNKILHDTSSQLKTIKSQNQAQVQNIVPDTSKSTAPNPVMNFQHMPYEVLFKIIPVKLFGPKKHINTYAFLDEGSSVTLVDNEIAEQLELDGIVEPLTLKWYGDKLITEPAKTVNIEISGVDKNSNKMQLTNVRAIKNLNLPIQTLNLSKLHSKYHHLKKLPIADYTKAQPKILIGIDNCHIGLPIQSKAYHDGEPLVLKTKLGVFIYGKTVPTIETDSVKHMLHAEIIKSDMSDLNEVVKEYFTTENFGVMKPEKKIISADDDRAYRIMESTTVKVGNRFETGLLWKTDQIELPDSLQMAINRLNSVERKMRKDEKYAEKYNENITSYLEKGYARLLSSEESKIRTSRTWYLPHFGVQNPSKPDKLRLVFDAAAKIDNVSLNSVLLSGPDQYSSLTAILFRFRQKPIAVCGDIKEMFHQIHIRKEDRPSQRFMWRNGDSSKEYSTYEMIAMTFGATCSPASAQFVRNKNATQFQHQCPRAVKSILKNHYVDDYVDCFDNEQEAIEVSQDVINIHRNGGFELRNFVSNSPKVHSILNGTFDTSQSTAVNMNFDSALSTDKILGMHWDTVRDEFRFNVKFHKVSKAVLNHDRKPTKREVLSIIMSIFDPFGLLANFLIYMKILMQDIWRSGIDWNDSISDDIYKKWLLWQDELNSLKNFHIPRCYSPNISNSDNIQLHVFVDASESAFAAVAYFRVSSENGIDVSIVAAKTRCAPQQMLSIPRLELQSAVLGVRLFNSIIECHDLKFVKCFFWTDAKILLHWIQSDHRKYKPFVAHRIAEVLESTTVNDWHWIPTKINVADDATRAKYPPKFQNDSRWITGPAFLMLDEYLWPSQHINFETLDCEVEIKQKHSVHHFNIYEPIIDLQRFSNYNKLKRTVAWIIRYKRNLLAKCQNNKRQTSDLTLTEVNAAEIILCQWSQIESFPEDYQSLLNKQKIPKCSELYQLTPDMGDDKLIRLFGRIDNALSIPVTARRPIILATNHDLTRLIVKYYHKIFHHINQETIICEIRRKFWIPNIRKLVKIVKRDCNYCKLKSIKPEIPIMGQLPEDRVTPFIRPFTYSGIDYFGPLNVTVGRRQEKRWVALFTCLTIRAVHLELATDLSTDACLLCIKNFINRRGVPLRIRSDNGTNFLGADRELRNQIGQLNNNKILSEMTSKGIDWKFNCPADPSSGGCWERLIQSIKKVLKITLKEKAPRVETLRSLLIEAENIVNSRPLTHIPIESEDEEPLTPNHFLLGVTNSNQIMTAYNEKWVDMRKQWRISQQLTNSFWKRWITEYLPTLTRRAKWFSKAPPLKENDLVIVCDADTPRCDWSRGRVVKIFRARDGQVRSAEIKVKNSYLRRPASKLAVLKLKEE